MALRAKWTVRLEGVKTQLAVGAQGKGQKPQPVLVNLVINGLTPDTPKDDADCLDHASICEWILHEWPKSAPTRLLEMRVNEMLDFLFGSDKRIQDAWVGVYMTGKSSDAGRIGVEKQMNRAQFQSRQRAASS